MKTGANRWEVPSTEKGFGLQVIIIGLIVATIGAIGASLWLQKKNAENKYHEEVASHAETRSAHNVAVASAAIETARAERIARRLG